MGEHVLGNCENMDVLFYEQTSVPASNLSRYDKNALRLNLEGAQIPSVVQDLRGNGKLGIYAENSPELTLFKMVSPELEKFIASNTGLTPKGNPGNLNSPDFTLFNLISPEFEKILASVQNPKSPTPAKPVCLREGNNTVKQQHEAYVQGFAEALQQIHDRQQPVDNFQRQNGLPASSGTDDGWAENEQTRGNSYQNQVAIRESSFDVRNDGFCTVTAYENHELNPQVATYNNAIGEAENFELEETLKRQAGNVLPLPPIDLELQEIVKRERKKQKNRVAASKCRKKKLEREAQLEVRVQQLKDKNIELNAVANALRQQVSELKQRVLEHVAYGCQLPAIATPAF
ncbi:transcription factor Jun-like [Montipora foliosa]|uniref:transcription factor Jun-like n=1 Tax=Montipora foliosa TaxID=591990 RepID=UPI0035F21A66